jgi:hypothetical protein
MKFIFEFVIDEKKYEHTLTSYNKPNFSKQLVKTLPLYCPYFCCRPFLLQYAVFLVDANLCRLF